MAEKRFFTNKEMEVKAGKYAPLVKAGTLTVDTIKALFLPADAAAFLAALTKAGALASEKPEPEAQAEAA